MSIGLNLELFSQLPENITKKIINDSGNLGNVGKVSRLLRYEAGLQAHDISREITARYDNDIVDLALASLQFPEEASIPSVVEAFFKEAKKLNVNIKASDPYHLLHLDNYMQMYAEIKDLNLFYTALYAAAPPSLQVLMANTTFDENPIVRFGQIKLFLNQHVQELAEIKGLNLGGFGLSSVPKEIALCTNLETLDLSGNKLTFIPSVILQLNHLTCLNFNYNNITKLPDGIGGLKNLISLSLDGNKIEKLPSQFCNLVNLQQMFLNNNLLFTLPHSMGKLKSLSLLSMTNNSLKELPDSIGDLINLKYLYLANNKIGRLPTTIGKLKSLEVLSAANNHLGALPAAIASIKNLKIIVISQNALLSLPGQFELMPNLEELHASGNRFQFPYGFTHLPICIAEANEDMGLLKTKHPYETSNEMFETVYGGLHQDKWKECIDGSMQVYGKYVFDQGLHGGIVEPGFVSSMENAFQFLKDNFHRKLDASLYLDLHRTACTHFQGPKTGTLVGQEKVGVFRRDLVKFSATFEAPDYAMSDEAINEFTDLNNWISCLFGPSWALGTIVQTSDSPKTHRIDYHGMSEAQVTTLFNFFLDLFHFKMNRANTYNEALIAIASLIQRLEWLHPVQDGCGRTDTALLNFLLAKYGFSPVLLQFPYLSSCRGLSEWVDYLMDGMSRWLAEATGAQVTDTPMEVADPFEFIGDIRSQSEEFDYF